MFYFFISPFSKLSQTSPYLMNVEALDERGVADTAATTSLPRILFSLTQCSPNFATAQPHASLGSSNIDSLGREIN